MPGVGPLPCSATRAATKNSGTSTAFHRCFAPCGVQGVRLSRSLLAPCGCTTLLRRSLEDNSGTSTAFHRCFAPCGVQGVRLSRSLLAPCGCTTLLRRSLEDNSGTSTAFHRCSLLASCGCTTLLRRSSSKPAAVLVSTRSRRRIGRNPRPTSFRTGRHRSSRCSPTSGSDSAPP